jgi:hypothetical protein
MQEWFGLGRDDVLLLVQDFALTYLVGRLVFNLLPSTPMINVLRSFEMFANSQNTTWHKNPEDDLYSHRRKKLYI